MLVLKFLRSFFQKAAADPTRGALVALRRGRNTHSFKAPERVNFGNAERGETTSGVSPYLVVVALGTADDQ